MSDELATLTQTWRQAVEALRAKDTVANALAEDAAYDALVEYVEVNDLNYTEHDPRGPKELFDVE